MPKHIVSFIIWMARLGFVAKALLYMLLGYLAGRSSFGWEQAKGQQGIFQMIASQRLGSVLLLVLAAGLLAYAMWRFGQAFLDFDREGKSTEGLGKRCAYAVSGLAYSILVVSAAAEVFAMTPDGIGGLSLIRRVPC